MTLHTRVQSHGHVKSVVNKRAPGTVFSSYCLVFSCQFSTNAAHRCVTRGKYSRPHCLETLSPHELPSRSSRLKDNSCSAILSGPRSLWDPKFQCHVYKSPSPVLISSQIGPFHTLPFHFFNIYFNIILPSISRSSKWSHSFNFPH